MEILNSIILGSVQGITEFLPISSSGHLILAREFLGLQVQHGLAYDAVLQLATTLAIIIYFYKDIWNIKNDRTMMGAIVVGTIPAVVLGLLLEDIMDTTFRNPQLIIVTLLLGAAVMAAAERLFANRKKDVSGGGGGIAGESLTIRKGFLIGCFQALALVPGMSRSGMTISGGLFGKLSREKATRFAFVLAFPILIGSGAKKLFDLGTAGLFESIGLDLFIGSMFAFIVGLAAIHFLITFLRKNTLRIFIWYRVVLAVLLFFLIV